MENVIICAVRFITFDLLKRSKKSEKGQTLQSKPLQKALAERRHWISQWALTLRLQIIHLWMKIASNYYFAPSQ